MKSFCTLLFTIVFALSYTKVTAQTSTYNPVNSSSECKERVDKLKAMHVTFLSSDTQKKYSQLIKEFNRKINLKGSGEKVENIIDDLMGWIKNNIDKTMFESYEAAEKEFEAISDASVAMRNENKEYYTYLNESRPYCGSGLIAKIVNEVSDEQSFYIKE